MKKLLALSMLISLVVLSGCGESETPVDTGTWTSGQVETWETDSI